LAGVLTLELLEPFRLLAEQHLGWRSLAMISSGR